MSHPQPSLDLSAQQEPELLFDPENHIYTLGGRRLLSVTQALGIAGFSEWLDNIAPDTLEYARDRGIAVHEALRLMDADELDWQSVDPVIMPYVLAYSDFKTETGFEVLQSEQAGYHQSYQYAGRWDRVGILQGAKMVLDFKSGSELRKQSALQLAAYERIISSQGDNEPIQRAALQLKSDGTYRLFRYQIGDNLRDFQVFLASLQVATWRIAKGDYKWQA